MKKRWAALCLSLVLCLSLLPGLAQAAGHFTDVKDTDWYYLYVEKAGDLGLLQGTGDGCFSPRDNLTRAESVTLAVRVHAWLRDQQPPEGGSGLAWFGPYETYAVEAGILSQPLTTSQENGSVSRAQCMEDLYRAVPQGYLTEKNTIPDGAIPDVAMDQSFAPAVYAFYRAGVLEGSESNGAFLPQDSILRCEIAATLVRLMVPEARVTVSLTGEPAQPTALEAIRAAAQESGDLCSVAFVGYGESIADFLRQTELGADLREAMPFLWALPESQFVTQAGNEIYCVVPTNPNASVYIRAYGMDESDGSGWGPGELLYAGGKGHALLLLGNVSDIIPNLSVEIVDHDSGRCVRFEPGLSLNDGSLVLPEEGGVKDITLPVQET